MSYDEPYDDEEWYDEDEEELIEEAPAQCPECGGPIYLVAHKCPACGYWLSNADRRKMWSGESTPKWVKITAAIVLVALVLSLLGVGALFF